MDNIYNYSSNNANYDTDFGNLREGCIFPSYDVQSRNIKYGYNMKLYNGDYAKNKLLVAMVDGQPQPINYKVLPTFKFETVINKLDSLMFGNEAIITTGDLERDKAVRRLVDRTHWLKGVREAVKLAEIYGDSYIKTGRFGVSAFSPKYAYKVIDISDKTKVVGYVLHEILYDTRKSMYGVDYTPSHIRILISCKGFDYERVFEYNGDNLRGTLGKPVRYKYKDRWIPRKGRYYWTGIDDCETVQCLSVNTTKTQGVYGTSALQPIAPIVFAIENRLSTENYVVDNHGKPLMLVSQQLMGTNENTGEYYLKVIDNKYIINKGLEDNKPEYLTWDGKLENSKTIRDDLLEEFYSLTEMGKTFLSGEYKGNISEESLNNLIKGAIDRGVRDLNDLWYDIVRSLYMLCRLNNIDVNIEDININFNIGRVDDTKQISEICETLDKMKLFSKETLLNKFWGYSSEDAQAEFERIAKEQIGGTCNESDGLA